MSIITKTKLSIARPLLLFLLLAGLSPVAWAAGSTPEVRVLIDVSGSMKNNDPNNLRQPALRLLVGVLPKESRAGVWNFAQGASMQVKPGKVTAQWRKLARQRANRIHSRGLYTNIEDALNVSTADWKKRDYRTKRNIILLTDGMVDLSKDPSKNAASRERILKKILPRLKNAGVKIHTIALSKNTDEELLRTLSMSTDGGFVQVDSADELERIFLRLFEKTSNIDTVPLQENKFKVDKSIRDFTVLIFRPPGKKDSTAIVSPSKQRYTYKKRPRSIEWHPEKNYDLVTVSNPEPGEWSLDAAIDPDNRVMIVTNLNLKVDSLPNNLMMGDELVIRSRLLQDRKTITNKKLLSLMRFTVHRRLGGTHLPVVDLLDNGQGKDSFAGDGVFSGTAGHFTKPGIYEISLKVIGETFNRQSKHRLEVRGSPARINVKKAKQGGFLATIRVDPSMLRTETVSIQLKLPDGQSKIIPQSAELEWQIMIPANYEKQEITATLVGSRFNGKELRMDLSHVLGVADKQDLKVTLPQAVLAKSATAEVDAGEGKDSHAEPTDHVGDSSKEDGSLDWFNVGGVFVAVNVLVIGFIVMIIIMLKKRRARKGGKRDEAEDIDTDL